MFRPFRIALESALKKQVQCIQIHKRRLSPNQMNFNRYIMVESRISCVTLVQEWSNEIIDYLKKYNKIYIILKC